MITRSMMFVAGLSESPQLRVVYGLPSLRLYAAVSRDFDYTLQAPQFMLGLVHVFKPGARRPKADARLVS